MYSPGCAPTTGSSRKNANEVPSGNENGSSAVKGAEVTASGTPAPAGLTEITYTRVLLPGLLPPKAIRVPSGDQRG